MLGAAALGDIGELFPDDDPAYDGADSISLLAEAVGRVRDLGFTVGNVDVVVVCERPKLAPYRELMARNLAGALGVPVALVGIKATTTEGMGFTGRREGIAATAVCLLSRAETSQ